MFAIIFYISLGLAVLIILLSKKKPTSQLEDENFFVDIVAIENWLLDRYKKHIRPFTLQITLWSLKQFQHFLHIIRKKIRDVIIKLSSIDRQKDEIFVK